MGKHKLHKWWLSYEYKHTTAALVGLFVFVLLFDSAFLTAVLSHVESWQYVGAFLAGILSASFFTAAPALVLIVDLAGQLDPLAMALLVGLGSAVGDMLLLLFFEERVFYELRPMFKKFKKKKIVRRTKGRLRSTIALLVGAFVIMTPLPDEIGLGLLGISHFPKAFLFLLCLALNTLGAALLISSVRVISTGWVY